jgi:hypothetical protein
MADSTAIRSLIGRNDIRWWDGATETYTRLTSTGGSLTLYKMGNDVDVLAVYGGYTSRTRATIQTALDRIGTTNKVALVLAPGDWEIDADLTIPANIMLAPSYGSRIVRLDGTSLTINSFFNPGRWQIFVDDSTNGDWVKFGAGSAEYFAPEWWGADPTGASDSTAAFEKTIECIKNSSEVGDVIVQPYILNAPGGKYVLTGGLFPGSETTGSGVYRWEGNGSQMTFDISGTAGICLDYTGKHHYLLNDLKLIGGTTNPPRIGILQSRLYHGGGGSSAGQAKMKAVHMTGTFLKYGIYNYASEGAHYTDCQWNIIAQNVIVITQGNYYSETIPHQDGTLANESCVEFEFDRCNILNQTLAADVDPANHSCMLFEGAGLVYVQHCEIHDLNPPTGSDTMPLVRIVTEWGYATSEAHRYLFDEVNFHSSYDVAVRLEGNATASDIRSLQLRQCRFNSTTADVQTQGYVRVHDFVIEGAKTLDFSSTGSGIWQNSIVVLGPAATMTVDSNVQGTIYRQSDSTFTFTTPAKMIAQIINKDACVEYTASFTWDPGSLATGDSEVSSAITVTGATLGMEVTVYPPYNLQGIIAQGYITSSDTARVVLYNTGAVGTINLVSGTWKIRVKAITGEYA